MAFLDLDDRSGRIQLQARVDVLGEERDGAPARPRPRRPRRRRRRRLPLAARRAVAARRGLRRCWPSRCARRPTSSTACSDVETRFRQRELDLIANEEARELFVTRARGHHRGPRATSTSAGFVEVETPVLQPLYGGALARPFTTHHNALDRDALPAHRDRAVPQAAASSAASSASTSSARTSATRASRSSTTPSSRWSSGTRPTRTTSDAMRRVEELRRRASPRPPATTARSTSRRPGGA